MNGFTTDEIKSIVYNSLSIKDIFVKINLKTYNANYVKFRKYAEINNIDISNFSKRISKNFSNKRKNIEEYLIYGKYIRSTSLKKYLIDSGLFERKCSCCNNTTWMDGDIPLELDHIDGYNKNNKIENLRLLCPNCHALTPTYRGKNIGNYKDK